MKKLIAISFAGIAIIGGIFFFIKTEKLHSYDEYTMDNGLRVILSKTEGAEVLSQVILYKAGRMDETAGKSGVAHFLEHLMFRGDNKEYSATIEKMGGKTNAYTSQDITVYYSMASSDNMEKLLELESKRMENLSFSEEEFKTEKNVVIEERVTRYDSSPRAQFFQKLNQIRWAGHPYSTPVIGIEQEFADVNEQDIKDFYENYYTPDNAVLVLSGNFDVTKAKELINKYYGGYNKTAKEAKKYPLPRQAKITISQKDEKISDDFLIFLYNTKTLSFNEKSSYALLLIAEYLGGQGYNSSLYQELVVKNHLTTDISAYYDGFGRDAGTFGIITTFTNTENKSEVQKTILQELKKIAQDGIPSEKLAVIKKVFIADFIFLKEDLFETANLLGSSEIYGYDIKSYEQDVNNINNEDIKSAMKELLNDNSEIIGYLQGTKDEN